MSDKELAIQAVQKLPDDCTMGDVVASLRSIAATSRQHSTGNDELNWDANELSNDEWRMFVAQGMKSELSDPREDIYTERNGEPADDAR